MSCPICAMFTAPTDRPVCSRRCADPDLARRLGGDNAVPVQTRADPLEALEDIARLEQLRPAAGVEAKWVWTPPGPSPRTLSPERAAFTRARVAQG